MATQYPSLNENTEKFIQQQKSFLLQQRPKIVSSTSLQKGWIHSKLWTKIESSGSTPQVAPMKAPHTSKEIHG